MMCVRRHSDSETRFRSFIKFCSKIIVIIYRKWVKTQNMIKKGSNYIEIIQVYYDYLNVIQTIV